MKTFEDFGLHATLVKSLAHMKYNTPTPIQAQAIPLALDGRDIMGTAQTGTGKTAAFAIPLVEALLRFSHGTALVMTPTRELGKQVMEIMHQLLGPKSNIQTAFLIGGEAMGKQYAQLRRKPRLIVGTPGRINDHLERGTLKLNETGFLVLDETDRMLDMGFSVQLDRILEYLPAERQTLMFSATLPKNILKLSQKYLDNPERVAVGSTINPAKNIKQDIIRVEDDKKYGVLLEQLEDRKGSVIVFVKTKHGTEKLAKKLNNADFSAQAIHGDLKQSRRDRVIREFRGSRFRILVATDVAARGLDIPHIQHVINYDLPQVAEDYIHRIGRTARAGASGEALCLIAPQDGRKWHAIEQLMNPDAAGKPPASGPKKRRGKPYRGGKRRFDNRPRKVRAA
jgi:superfamily II DNA/RNA helicase